MLRLVAMLGAALAAGGCISMLRHRVHPLLALALLLLALSAIAEHVTKWSAYPVPVLATLLDIAGFAMLGAYLWGERRKWVARDPARRAKR
jgi:hypothetical protein